MSDPDDGKFEEIAVLGHDRMWHAIDDRRGGVTRCGMGRCNPLVYEPVPVECMLCLAMVPLHDVGS